MWTKITNRIIKKGSVWSTEDFNPTPEDIHKILEIAGDGEVGIARKAKPLLVFVDRKFDRCGVWFRPQNLPEFCSEHEAKIAYSVKKLKEFSTDEFAEMLYPEYYMRGKAWRSKTNITKWSPYKRSGFEKYDWRKYARTLGYNDLNRIALVREWVQKEGTRWKSGL